MKKLTPKMIFALMVAVPLGFGGLLLDRPVQAATPLAATQSGDPTKFADGAKAWAETCARCHNMRDPKELRDEQWRATISHMRVRANLTGGEARDILAFLQGVN